MGFAPSNLASKKFILKFVELVGYINIKRKSLEKNQKVSQTGDGVHSDDDIPVGRFQFQFTGAGEPCIFLGDWGY